MPALVRRTRSWELSGGEGEPQGDARTQAAWDAGLSGLFLAADVEPLEGDCAGASVAWPSTEAAPIVFTPEERGANRPAPRVVSAALGAFRELPTYRSVQDDYLRDGAQRPTEERSSRPPRWEDHEGAGPRVTSFRAGTRRLLFVSAASGMGCGDFYGALWALFELETSGALSLRATDQQAWTPGVVLEVSGERRLELQGEERMLYQTDDGFEVQSVEVPFGCPC